MTDEIKTLAQLEEAYEVALTIYRGASRDYADAGSRECQARNTLNAVQKSITAKMDELRRNAPRDSDWQRKEIVV